MILPEFYVNQREIWYTRMGKNIGFEEDGIRPCLVIQRQRDHENTCIVLPASRTKRFSTISIGKYSFLMHQIRSIDTLRLIKEFERMDKKHVDLLCDTFSNFIKK